MAPSHCWLVTVYVSRISRLGLSNSMRCQCDYRESILVAGEGVVQRYRAFNW